MIRHTLQIMQHLLQDFQSVFDHFGLLRIKRLKQGSPFQNLLSLFTGNASFILKPVIWCAMQIN